jgi:para-nitrobenzyl esterase
MRRGIVRKFVKWIGGLLLVLMLVAAALWFFLFRPPPRGAPAAPVKTASGPVRGLAADGITTYLGLPYAAAPVGALRWREPQPVAAWTHTRDAFMFRRSCPQVGGPVPGMLPPEPQSEDCLYLNVWTPAKVGSGAGDKPLPVIVWLHGGSNTNGSASAYPYWGTQLARKGVVIVSPNYRLGALGFLAHPELTAESSHHASGNYGMMDQIAALKWVQANIRAFGGDPANVTLMGHSAGAWDASHLQVSPLARALYRRVIAMSGGNFGPAGTKQGTALLPDAESAGVRFATHLGARSLAALRALPFRQITDAPTDLWRATPNASNTAGIVDGYVVPAPPADGYKAGQAAPVDLLVGYTSEEGVNWAPEQITAAKYREELVSDFEPFADRFLALYPARSDAEATRSRQRLEGERAFKWQVATWARLHAATKTGEVFLYRFSHTPGIGPFRRLGPGHGSELGHVFDFPKRGMRYGTQWPWNARRDSDLVDTIQSYWVNFARTGNPNGPGLAAWPAFASRHEAIDLGDHVHVVPWPDAKEHQMMDNYMNAVRQQASKGGVGSSR